MKKLLFILIFSTFIFGQNEFLQRNIYMCEDNDGLACDIAGAILSIEEYAKEYGEEIDYFRANIYLKKACDLGQKTGCFNLGVSYDLGQGADRDFERSNYYYEKACDLGHDEACFVLGMYYESYFDDSIKYFKKACDLGNKDACNNAGALFFNNENMQNAIEYFKKACDLKDEMGCKNLHILD